MPTSSPSSGSARSVEELNAAIRALFSHRDARLTDEQREEYRRLLAELRQVERGEITTAA
jgi:Mor family transcriptional regulator